MARCGARIRIVSGELVSTPVLWSANAPMQRRAVSSTGGWSKPGKSVNAEMAVGGKPRHNVRVSGPPTPSESPGLPRQVRLVPTHPDVGLMKPYRVQRGHVGLRNPQICHRQSSFDRERGTSTTACFWRGPDNVPVSVQRMIPWCVRVGSPLQLSWTGG